MKRIKAKFRAIFEFVTMFITTFKMLQRRRAQLKLRDKEMLELETVAERLKQDFLEQERTKKLEAFDFFNKVKPDAIPYAGPTGNNTAFPFTQANNLASAYDLYRTFNTKANAMQIIHFMNDESLRLLGFNKESIKNYDKFEFDKLLNIYYKHFVQKLNNAQKEDGPSQGVINPDILTRSSRESN